MSMPFPLRPKLRSYYRVVFVQEDKLLLQGGGNSLMLRGSSVRDFIPRLISYLDGSFTIEQIVVQLPDVEPDVVLEALTFFQERHLLEDGAEQNIDHAQSRYAHQTSFWLAVNGQRYALQEKLAEARVAIFGLGIVGSMTAASLALAGVGRIDLIDSEKVSTSDQLAGSYSSQHIGQSRALIMKEYLPTLHDHMRCEAFTQELGDARTIASIIDGCTMALVCHDSPSLMMEGLLNEACLERGITWSRGCIDYNHAVIGPTVIPKQTACFSCFQLRLRSNATYMEDAVAFDEYLRTHEPTDEGAALLVPYAGLVAHHLALEALKVITGFAYPASAGAFLSLNCLTGEFARHLVLKLPRCPSCSTVSTSPRMKIWDLAVATETTAR